MKFKTKRSGFTLVELIVSLTIFLMLLGSICYTLGIELSFWERITEKGKKQQIANMLLSRIVQDIRSAEEVLATSDKKTLALKTGDDTIEYSIKNQKVRRKKNNYSSYLTDKQDIKALSFDYPQTKLVGVRIEEWSTKACLRN